MVGGGTVAERKTGSLLDSGAKVRLVSPTITNQIRQWAELGRIELVEREYSSSDLAGVWLVFAATNNPRVNRQVSEDCELSNLAVNVADDPDRGNFFVPSAVRRGNLTIAISTGGASPLLAAKIRRELEAQYGPEYAEFIEILSDVRRRVLSNVADIAQRKAIFNDLVESDILKLLKEKKYDQVKERLEKCLLR